MAAAPVYVLTVGGVVVPLRLGFQIQEAANAQGKLTADVYSADGTMQPALGDEVQLREDGVVIFGGVIDTPTAAGAGTQPIRPTITRIQASDFNSLARRRVVNMLYPAGTLKSWLGYVLPFLSIYGVTLDPAQADGPTMGDFFASYMRLDDVLKQFSTLSNWVWEIDYTKTLRMIDPNTRAAPFDVLPGNRAAFGDISVGPTQNDYGNHILVLFGSGLHETTEAWTGDGTTTSYPLTYTYASSRGYVTNNPPGHTGPDINETLGTPPALWSVDPATNTLTRVAGAPVAGAAIRFIYTAAYPSTAWSGAAPWPTPPGLWEKLYREPDIFDLSQAQSLGDSYLAQSLNQQRTVKYTTKQQNIHPGMVQRIVVPERMINGQFLVTAVTVANPTGKAATRQVTAIEGTDLGTDWRDMIRNWNTKASGSSGSPAYIPPSGGGGGGGATITGANDYLVKIAGPNQGVQSTMSESGGVVNFHGGNVAGVNDLSATTLHGAYDASQLTGSIADARLSPNVALLNRASQAFTGNLTVGGTFGVTGASSLAGLTAGSSTLASLGVTTNATIGGTLGVTGAATMSATLGVSGVVSGLAFKPTPLTAGAPGELFLGNYGLTLWAATGSSYDFGLLQPNGNPIARVPIGTNQIELAGGLNSIGHVSGTTGWSISAGGVADFRGMTTDEMNVKTFIVNQQRALTGGEIIAMSAAAVAADFTVPALGGAATLTVQDIPGAPGLAAFASGDAVTLFIFARTTGTLTVARAVGVVSAPTLNLAGGTQSWTWTRNTSSAYGGGAATGATVAAGSVAIDFGTSGAGFIEIQGADTGAPFNADGPYVNINTWTTAPTYGANMATRTRLGNLYGITNIANEYGLIAGTYAATNGQYFRASSSAFELHGIDLLLWDGATNTVKIDHAVPSIALGNPRPTGFNTGTGFWVGKNGTQYQLFLGQTTSAGPPSKYLAWDGANLSLAGGYVYLFDSAGNNTFLLNPTVPSFALGNPLPTAYSGSNAGVWMGRDTDGVYKFRCGAPVGGSGNSLSWDGTTLAIHGTVTANAGQIGALTIDATNGNLGFTGLEIDHTGMMGVGTTGLNNWCVLSSYGIPGIDSTLRFWVGAYLGSVRVIEMSTSGRFYAQGPYQSATGGGYGYGFAGDASTAFYSDVPGRAVLIASGKQIYWDGSALWPAANVATNLGTASLAYAVVYAQSLVTSTTVLLLGAQSSNLVWDGAEFYPQTAGAKLLGHPSYPWNNVYANTYTTVSDRRLKTEIGRTIYRTTFVRQLRPVDFTWIDGHGGARQTGLIAQDVAAIAPEFSGITRDADGEPIGLNYSALVVPLIVAVQELLARVEHLETRGTDGE